MAPCTIGTANGADRNELAEMRALLWPDTPVEELLQELESNLNGGAPAALPSTTLVSHGEDGKLTGFVEVGLRSHADGCDVSRPVGFVEGWFVRQQHRNQGVGRELIRAAEEWSRAQGCREMASDALIDNDASVNAHQALGFEIVDRCVHFRKNL
jgi:aminoglycoside 6'-N-acetyltransferase I